MAERLNEQELARLVAAQKRELTRLKEQLDEARGIAKTLLRDLRNHADIPAIDPSFHWLCDDDEGVTEEKHD